jgi:predicted outer membrane protein
VAAASVFQGVGLAQRGVARWTDPRDPSAARHLAARPGDNKVIALCDKLKVMPESNDTSKTMYREAPRKREELRALSGAAFDKAYAENEVTYHEAVDGALESTLIPSAQNGQLGGARSLDAPPRQA